MKWQSHKLCNTAIVYGITGNLQATIIATIGAILPDLVECNGIIQHRTITHFPYLYVIPMLLLFPFYNKNYTLFMVFWIITGCLIHVILDSLSKGGIPYKTPYGREKIALNLYTTHHVSEWYIAMFIVLIFGMLGRFNMYISNDHFTNEIMRIVNTVMHFKG